MSGGQGITWHGRSSLPVTTGSSGSVLAVHSESEAGTWCGLSACAHRDPFLHHSWLRASEDQNGKKSEIKLSQEVEVQDKWLAGAVWQRELSPKQNLKSVFRVEGSGNREQRVGNREWGTESELDRSRNKAI